MGTKIYTLFTWRMEEALITAMLLLTAHSWVGGEGSTSFAGGGAT
jgi:hypothetical protein